MSVDTNITERFSFTGQVQGVGFRWTTNRIATGFAVTGFVRNRLDGTVELIVQGSRSAIDSFVSAVKSHFAKSIRSMTRESLESQNDFACFEIRR